MVESSISDDICRHQLIQLTSPDLLNFICKSNVENLISKGFHIFSVNSLVLYICLIYVFALTFCLHICICFHIYMYLFNIPFQDFDQSPVYSSIVNFTFDIHVFVFIYVFVNNCLHSGKLYLPVYFSVQPMASSSFS